ncbi:unnamed protein product, partial [Amoebophrya sp. A25]|eukprot:GSA25T00010691001.1
MRSRLENVDEETGLERNSPASTGALPGLQEETEERPRRASHYKSLHSMTFTMACEGKYPRSVAEKKTEREREEDKEVCGRGPHVYSGIFPRHAYSVEALEVFAVPLESAPLVAEVTTATAQDVHSKKKFLLVYGIQLRNPHALRGGIWNPFFMATELERRNFEDWKAPDARQVLQSTPMNRGRVSEGASTTLL